MAGTKSAPVKYSSGRLRVDTRQLSRKIDKVAGESLLVAGGQEIQGGFTTEEFEISTPANGATVTIDPLNGQKQRITNNVAGFTIEPSDECGDVELRIINGASAGTITFSGFHHNYPGGADLTTVDEDEFVVFIFGFGAAGTDYIVQARQ